MVSTSGTREKVNKEFFYKRVEIGGIDWYNTKKQFSIDRRDFPMKRIKLTIRLPWIVLALGIVGLGLRWILYRVNLDERLLLKPGHPLEILLWLLTAGTLVLITLSAMKRKEPTACEGNSLPSTTICIGCCIAAFLICYTVLSMDARLPGIPGILWKVLGVLCAPCLLAVGFGHLPGQKPLSLPYVVPCLFYMFHVINHYRVWSSEPQLESFFYPLFASIALTFFLFYTAAFAVDIPHRRMQIAAGLSGIYLCMTDLSRTDYPWLCLAGGILCLTGLCAPAPQTEESKEGNRHDPA